MTETLIFGAGGQGRCFIQKQGLTVGDALLTDNNQALWGSEVAGLLVIPPDPSLLSLYQRIIITSSFAKEIHAQLIAAGVENNCIHIPIKSLVTPKEVLSEGMRALALRVLDEAFRELLVAEIPAFIDYGTLLGIWRDKRVLAHDGDVDVTVLTRPGDTAVTYRVAAIFLQALGREGCAASLISDDAGNQLIEFASEGSICYFDIHSLQHRGGAILWEDSGATNLVSGDDLLPLREIHDPIGTLVPNNTERYLRALYGDDWETPIDDWPLSYGLSRTVFVTMRKWTKEAIPVE